MFTELTIKNFQSLSEAKLKLGRINVIVGPSYLGKSAIIRAIHAITRNRFEASFMKQGTSHTRITLSEGDTMVEYNRDTSSSYKWTGNPEPYTKIGRDVPQDIRSFFKMDEIVFDEDLMLDFNIQRQFDPAFIVSLSGFEVAKVFGKLMNLDIVLTASREISRDIQQLNKKKDECLAIQDVSVKYIQEHCSIELKNTLLHEALELDAEAEKLDLESEKLLQLIAEIEAEQTRVEEFTKLLQYLDSQEIDKIEAPIQGFEDVLVGIFLEEEKQVLYKQILDTEIPEFDWSLFDSLESLIVDLLYTKGEIENYSNLLKSLEVVDFDSVSTIEVLQQIISSGESLNSDYLNAKQALSSVEQEIINKQQEFDVYLQNNKVCPITQMMFSDECIQRLKVGMS